MALSRRDILRNSALGAGVLAVGNVGALLGSKTALALPSGSDSWVPGGAYGPLIEDPNGLLDLPDGFKYTIVTTEGDAFADGAVPGRFDGMAAFAGPAKAVALVRNHEITAAAGGLQADADFVYDPAAGGGTTNVHLDRNGNKLAEFTSLAGTIRNCAGGTTPWGTWLTCEENENVPGAGPWTKRHGYAFEVDPWNQDNNREPTPLLALGRFAKEAAVVDPSTLDVYVSEDAGNPFGLMYKAVLDAPEPRYGGLRGTGTLYAMACTQAGAHVANLHPYSEIGTTLDVAWVEVTDPDALVLSVRKQFTDAQVTRSQKYEGLWWDAGKCYIAVSFANDFHSGQVWSLDPLTSTITLEVRFESAAGDDTPNEPDNITVSPWGGLILCEDGSGAQHLMTVAPDGSTSVFAKNRVNEDEFAGACFSPDGKTMYVNLYSDPGTTYAITGPWSRISRVR